MSKFVDKLEKAGLLTPAPFGFGAASRREESIPPILLIGRITVQELADSASLAEVPVDALLVVMNAWKKSSVEAVASSLRDRLWGAQINKISEEQTGQLKEKGCDFVVFDPADTAAALLNDEDLGKIMAVGADLNEDAARAIQELPIDAVLFSPGEKLLPLTVQKLIEIQQVRGLVDKAFLMSSPLELRSAELELFRNAGIAGLVTEMSSAEAIAKIRESVVGLPRRRPKPKSRDVIAPSAHFELDVPGQGEEEEGGEEE